MSTVLVMFLAVELGIVAEPPAMPAQTPASSMTVTPSSTGARRYEPGSWGAVALFGQNRSDHDLDSTVSIYLDEQKHDQFVRRFWVPAQASRQTWVPIRIPDDLPHQKQRVEGKALFLDDSDERDTLDRAESQQLRHTFDLIVDHEAVKTGMVFPLPAPGTDGSEEPAYQLLVTSRQSVDLTRTMVDLYEYSDFLPPLPECLEALDQIVIASDRILDDSAGIAALRSWLQRGGRIWIMLDYVSPRTVRTLLGGAVNCEVVDRTELTEFEMEYFDAGQGSRQTMSWTSEQPVAFVRVLTNSTDVVGRIDGWPAAFWQPVGRGEVLITTLGPSGWMRAGAKVVKEEETEASPEFVAPDQFRPGEEFRRRLAPRPPGRETPALMQFVPRMFLPRDPPPLALDDVKPLLQEQIGYSIPSRGMALLLLVANGLALVLVGVWLARRQRLEQMAYWVPGLCLVTAAGFVGIGVTNTRSVPPSVAITQWVRVGAETGQSEMTTWAAVYQPTQATTPFAAEAGQLVQPDTRDLASVTKRLLWDDTGRATWSNLHSQPGTIRFVRVDQARRLPHTTDVRGSFGAAGFQGRVRLPPDVEISDAVIVAPPGLGLAVPLQPDGRFQSGREHVLSRNQYLSGAMLTDQQRRRQQLLRTMLTPSEVSTTSKALTMHAWSADWSLDLDLPTEYQQTGDQLISIPVTIEPTPPGTPFQVPSSFIRVETARGAQGTSFLYNPRTGQWIREVAQPTDSFLRFAIPKQVLPCRLQRADLAIRINAPARTLTVRSIGPAARTLLEVRNPNGVVNLAFDNPSDLSLDAEGGLILEIKVGPTDKQVEASVADRAVDNFAAGDVAQRQMVFESRTWHIDYVRLDVTGTTLNDSTSAGETP